MPAFSVYLEGTRSHNEGRVSTPACYLLLYSAEGLHFSALLVISRTESFQENRLFHFQAHVVLKPLVSLIRRLVARKSQVL